MTEIGIITDRSGAPERIGRVAALDIARTMALLAMAVFHFVFDLELFGFVAPGTIFSAGWRGLAVGTAGSFILLAGVGLVLAHGAGIRWTAFWRRLAMVAGAAGAISAVTFFAMPGSMIFFGILHAIAAMSLIGLALLRVPVLVLLALAVFAFSAPMWLRDPVFNAPWLWWTGLQTVGIRAMDYEPIFPWIAPFLVGMAGGKLAVARGWVERLAARPTTPLQQWLSWPGRHSLAVYLIHQPVLVALVWIAAQVLR